MGQRADSDQSQGIFLRGPKAVYDQSYLQTRHYSQVMSPATENETVMKAKDSFLTTLGAESSHYQGLREALK